METAGGVQDYASEREQLQSQRAGRNVTAVATAELVKGQGAVQAERSRPSLFVLEIRVREPALKDSIGARPVMVSTVRNTLGLSRPGHIRARQSGQYRDSGGRRAFVMRLDAFVCRAAEGLSR